MLELRDEEELVKLRRAIEILALELDSSNYRHKREQSDVLGRVKKVLYE